MGFSSQNEKNTFLVTGAGGFIGANLCHRLVEEGQTVHIFIKSTSNLWRLKDIQNNLYFHEVDLSRARQVLKTVQDIQPAFIYHLAAYGAYPFQKDTSAILKTNIIGTWNLLYACDHTKYKLFINTGSSSEYGRRRSAMRESDRVEPDSSYAIAKVAQTLLCRNHARQLDRPITTFRIFSAYGPYEESSRLIPRLLFALFDSKPIDMVNPQTARDFVYVEDVVRTYRHTDPLYRLRGEVINLGTGSQSTLAQVVSILEKVSGRRMAVRWNVMPPRQWDKSTWVADINRLRSIMKEIPQTRLNTGLKKSLAWFRENRQLYPVASRS